MTRIGEYLAKKSINRASVSRKTGISNNRLDDLCNKESARLLASELYIIALAISADPCELLNFVCEGIKPKDS